MMVLDAVSSRIPAPLASNGRYTGWIRQAGVRGYGSLLVLVAVLVALHRLWGAELVLCLLLLTLPGVLLLRALRVPGTVVASFPVYVPAASLAVLTVSGLAVDIFGLATGISHPLRTVPLLIGIELSCAALLVPALRAPDSTAIPWRSLSGGTRRWWPMLIPLLAGAGAMRLNGGHSNAAALLALCACLAAIAWGIARAPCLDGASHIIVLYAVSLAVMWAYSLRGDIVYGFDISTEYHALHQTIATGTWHFSHPGDAYGALLAVTVLPAELHFLSGISGLMVLKLLYPAITALLPVGIYSLGTRIVDRRWAFIAASFIVVQSTFAQELPAIARQEIAMLFFIALLGVIFDASLDKRAQWVLGAVFGVGMVLSHYSTTYFTIGMLAMLMVLQWATSWFRDIPRVTSACLVAFLVTTAGAVIWYGPVTRSASNVSQFISLTTSQGLDLLPNQGAGQNLISAYLNGNTHTAMTASQYQHQVAQFYASTQKFVRPLPDASEARYALRDSSAPEPAVRFVQAQNLVNLLKVVAGELAQLLGAVGAIMLALRKKTPLVARQIALLGAGTMFALVVIRLSGTVASSYNQQRAFLQAFAVLSITMSWTLQALTDRIALTERIRRWQPSLTIAAAVALMVLFAEMSGLSGAVLGGGTATNLANSGEDYERYYTTAPEIASARWLGKQFRSGELVYADRYGTLRLNAETSISRGLLNDITPQTLDRSAWVYASQTNLVEGRARQEFEGHMVSYAFPIGFLDANFNVLYTNGSSEVFRG